jgi:hypothetical protein
MTHPWLGGTARRVARDWGRVEMSLDMAKLRELADELGYWPATTDPDAIPEHHRRKAADGPAILRE